MNNTCISNAYKSHFNSNQYAYYYPPTPPFCGVFAHVSSLRSHDKGIFYGVYVVVQFYPWFNFYFLLFLGMVIYDNELKTKENKN